jgi:hypothetical protein
MPFHVNSRSKLKNLEADDFPRPEKRHEHGVTLLALIDSLSRMQPPAGSPLPMWIGWLYERREVHRLLGEAFRMADHAHRMQAKHLDRMIARLTHQLAEKDAEDEVEKDTAQPVTVDLCAMCASLPENFRGTNVRWLCHVCHGGRGGKRICRRGECETEEVESE